jgi:hypothetical protein
MAVFVIAGIGVDDIFIMVHAFDRQPASAPEDVRLAGAIRRGQSFSHRPVCFV